ncbi:MAG: FAD-binding oxidoreductase [Candidatus Krumholzibacteria bacterium]|nr:FAD-binding oxidoreductase [Candidatus Krumholzibacteria bacterium]
MYTKEYRQEEISGWSNYPRVRGNVFRPERVADLSEILAKEKGTVLARGGGTSYGDASINKDGLNVDTKRLNKMLGFNTETGLLHCQSGVTLRDIIATFLPRGWFLNVTPGSRLCTVGGCVACDAHGKNWKAGSFGRYVKGLRLMLHDGDITYCDDNNHADLYYATIGGMGMTGIILDVQLQLKKIDSSLVDVETVRFGNLRELFDLQSESMESHEYLFSWFDSHKEGKQRGRGVLQRANHGTSGGLSYEERKRIPIPVYLPGFVINRLSVEAFNAAYYLKSSIKRSKEEQHLIEYFYPLDRIGNWNRFYGKKGFIEYQIAVPEDGAYDIIEELLQLITRSKLGSTVAAIKPLTKSRGLLSFPIDGYTMAVDFAYDDKLWKLLDELDKIIIQHGGRVYLAKDSRLNADNFSKMYTGSLDEWESIRGKYKVENRFDSLMFERLRRS